MYQDMDKNRQMWEGQVVKGDLRWPDEHVIRFIKRHFKQPEATRVLDFGCGVGRDALALLQEGYGVTAMDCNQAGLDILQQRAEALGVSARLQCVLNHAVEVPLEEGAVDAWIADGSLFYNFYEERIRLMRNLHRCMKNGGLCWGNWRSKEDFGYGKGTELEQDVFRLGADAGDRDGFIYYFAGIEELEKLYQEAGFMIRSIDRYEFTRNNRKERCSWWLVVAEKKETGAD